jgi:hypothetical protein
MYTGVVCRMISPSWPLIVQKVQEMGVKNNYHEISTCMQWEVMTSHRTRGRGGGSWAVCIARPMGIEEIENDITIVIYTLYYRRRKLPLVHREDNLSL